MPPSSSPSGAPSEPALAEVGIAGRGNQQSASESYDTQSPFPFWPPADPPSMWAMGSKVPLTWERGEVDWAQSLLCLEFVYPSRKTGVIQRAGARRRLGPGGRSRGAQLQYIV